ncbi:hypothetical protein CEXT_375501 [Caerostris extrusa]|uniref:Uncharacterized protein n=1 Tax=Caerostris extrusa TaxID=172846 RepID=A0AAV4NZ58_CAEEX|nr:hypothetical protein CEXT_375501 [Caerostris extrusa]
MAIFPLKLDDRKKEEKCRGATNCLAHNDFLPSRAAGFFLDLPITAIRFCMVHPSVFLEQMSAANDPVEVPPGLSPAFICIELKRGQACRKRVAAFLHKVIIIRIPSETTKSQHLENKRQHPTIRTNARSPGQLPLSVQKPHKNSFAAVKITANLTNIRSAAFAVKYIQHISHIHYCQRWKLQPRAYHESPPPPSP